VVLASGRTHDQVLADLRPRHRPALQAAARDAGVGYPPDRLTLVGLKREKQLEVWASGSTPGSKKWRLVRSYPVLAASGTAGPKLREGDLQVPEGIYRLTGFNPNSSYHLSVRVDYPNGDDRAVARSEGRGNLGGDIFIHGRAVSIGCLAIGDDAIEELYVLLADVGLPRARLVLTPAADPAAAGSDPVWMQRLYERLRTELGAVRSQP
jgi:murein L,D-transpeptidase YafK